MAASTENKSRICTENGESAQASFMALRYHFGMLLGVTDFETEQSYHRGKMRLHNTCLHGEGVVWGFDVRLDSDKGEIRVLPGLALDRIGRELHLDADACLNVAAWFAAYREGDRFFDEDPNDGQITFDAHVVIHFKTCLTRQVPALSEPCENAGTTTAYSRVFETVEILLRPGHPPASPAPPYHRLRLLFGLEQPRLDEDGDILAGDQDVLDAPKDLDSFRKFAAFDEIDLKPPDATEFAVTLAQITGITLAKNGEQLKLTGGEVDVTVRPSHVATATIQELLCGSLTLAGSALVVAGSVEFDTGANRITFQVTAPLDPAGVTPAQFSVTFLDAAGWQHATISAANLDAPSNTVQVDLDDTAALPQPDRIVRFIAKGSGPEPLVGADAVPFNNGRDFVHMQKWS
jgi:hypothetical protein